MPLQSLDQIVESISGTKNYQAFFSKYIAATPVAGYWYDYSTLGGDPVANTYAGGAVRTSVQLAIGSIGAMYHGGDVSPSTKHIMDFILSSVSAGNLFLLSDFLLYYRAISLNSTAQQDLTNSVGLPRYTDGKGVRAFLVTTSAAGATAASLTMSYTNSEDVSGRTLPMTASIGGSSPINHISHSGAGAGKYGPFLPLAEGDVGIKSVQWVKLSKAMGSGVAALVLCKPLVNIPITLGYFIGERECVKELPSLPRIYDGAYLGLLGFITALTYRTMLTGFIDLAWD